MNKFMLRKPLALLLSVVMLVSSALVYVPAYANPSNSPGCCYNPDVPYSGDIEDFVIVQGQQAMNEFHVEHSFVLIDELSESSMVWRLIDCDNDQRYWMLHDSGIDPPIGYLAGATELQGTTDLSIGTYGLSFLDLETSVPTNDPTRPGPGSGPGDNPPPPPPRTYYDYTRATIEVVENVLPEAYSKTLSDMTEDEMVVLEFDVLNSDKLLVTDYNNDNQEYKLMMEQRLSFNGAVLETLEAGTLTFVNDLKLEFMPAENYVGPVSIRFTAKDDYHFAEGEPDVFSNEAWITFNVVNDDSKNDKPLAVEDEYVTDMNVGTVWFDPSDNDTDPDPADSPYLVEFSVVPVDASKGTVEEDSATDMVRFNPAQDFHGTANLTYQVTDGTATVGGTIKVIVNSPGVTNYAPSFGDLEVATSVDVPLGIDPLMGVTDDDDDDLSFKNIGAPTFGTAALNINDSTEIIYTPPAGWTGVAEFTVDIVETDTHSISDLPIKDKDYPRIIRVSVVPTNAAELDAEDDFEVTTPGTMVTIEVLENDTTPNLGLSIQNTDLILPENGTVNIRNDLDPKVIEYTPNVGFSGVDLFEYEITDNSTQVSRAFVIVDVRNTTPYLGKLPSRVIVVGEDNSTMLKLLMDYRGRRPLYPYEAISKFEIVSAPKRGIATLDLLGRYHYTAHKTFDNEKIYYDRSGRPYRIPMISIVKMTLSDDSFAMGCIAIYVNEVDKILLTDDVRTVKENTENNYFPILDNDTIVGVHEYDHYQKDEEGLPFYGPFHGEVTFDDMGVYYTPEKGYIGIDTFRYFVIDKDRWGDVAQVIVSIEPDQEIPVEDLEDYNLVTFSTVPTLQNVLNRDVYDLLPAYFDKPLYELDVMTHPGSLEVTAKYVLNPAPSIGAVAVVGNDVTFDPNGDMTTVDIEYTVEDQFGHMGVGFINVRVRSNPSEPYINVDNDDLDRYNQYSDPEIVWSDVTYTPAWNDTINPAEPFDIEYRYTRILGSSGEHYYNSLAVDANDHPASIVYFYGDFDLSYVMKDESGFGEISDQKDNIYINGRPILKYEAFNPEDVILPGDHEILPSTLVTTEILEQMVYYGELLDIFDLLYAFDYEDNRTDGQQTMRAYAESFEPDAPLVPVGMELKYYLEGDEEGRVLDNLWNDLIVGRLDRTTVEPHDFVEPEGSIETGVFEEGHEHEGVVYTKYEVQFSLTDSEKIASPDGYESELTDVLVIYIMNNEPVLENVPVYQIYAGEDEILPTAGIIVDDPEDEALLEAGVLTVALEENIVFKVYDADLIEVDLDVTSINELTPGIYHFVYSYIDSHGAFTNEETLVVILSEPIIQFNPRNVEMEPGGLFPVFNGLDIVGLEERSYSECVRNELYKLFEQAGIEVDIDVAMMAYVIENEVMRELDDLERIYVDTTIYYKVVINLDFELDGIFETISPEIPYKPEPEPEPEPFPEYDVVIETSRDVTVSDESMGQIMYMTDRWSREKTDDLEVYEVEPVDIGDYNDFDVYSLLMKFNPETGQRRLVTAVEYVYENNEISIARSNNDIDFDKECDPDDIVVSKTGEIYIVKGRYMMKLNETTMMFEEIFDIKEELADYARAFGFSVWESDWCIDYQSLTMDDRGYLVLALEDDSLDSMLGTDGEIDFDKYDSVLLYFNPLGFIPDMPDAPDGDNGTETTADPIEQEVKHLVELALIDYGTVAMDDDNGGYEIDKVPYDGIGDLAYDSEFNMIYGIGSYCESSIYLPDEGEKTDVESGKTKRGGKYFELFALKEEVKLVVEPGDTELEDIDRSLFAKYYQLTSIYNELDFGYKYKGMAVLGDNIYITRYMTPNSLDDLNEMNEIDQVEPILIPVALRKTEVEKFVWDEGFVNQYDIISVDGMFMAATGAAGMETEMTLDPESRSITLYNDELATSKTALFTLITMPVESFDNIQWTVDSEDTSYVTHDGNGTFTLSDNVSSGMTIDFVVSAMNLYSGSIEEIDGTVIVDYKIRPVIPQDDPDEPDDPRPRRTTPTTTPVRVTLDTDAVTLDYGETADPEFTSYDFTETVTGTTNRGVSWELSDDTFVTVDENGVITAKADVPTDTGDFTVTLTVRTDVGNATDTATILFEEQTPLGAIEFFDPYIAGYPDNSFRPTNYVTRAEVASMFAKILKLNTTTSGSQKFMDVPNTHWAYGQIQAMYRSGVFAGYMDVEGSRFFDPEAPISRAEIAQVFTNYWMFLDISVNGGSVTSVPDVDSNFWAAPAINRIFNTGIVTSFADGTYRPNEATLREQIVSMINRLIDRPANKADASKFTDILPTHNHFGDIEAASQTFLKPQPE